MSGRTTTLVVQGHESEPFEITAGVPQGSTLSPILFILYNAELLDLCNRPHERISAISFSDDVNILTYGRSTETNCRTLEAAHSRCLEWAKRHGMSFAPKKYELIHFTRSHTKFNLQAGIDFGHGPVSPSPDVRILGVWLDTKLRWAAHIREIQKKAASQQCALTRIASSTWGASFARARQIYMAVIRPALTHGALAWHNPLQSTRRLAGVAAKLRTVQNKCLRTIAGAYRATPTDSLEVETFIPPISLYLDSRVAASQARLASSTSLQAIKSACAAIKRRLKFRPRGWDQKPTLGQAREAWVRQRATDLGGDTIPEKERVIRAWTRKWERIKRNDWDQIQRPPDRKILKLHQNLRKAESSALIQFRTGRVGLARFLHTMRVPGYNSPECECGQGSETPRHVLCHCPLEEERRQSLRAVCGGRRVDLVQLLDTPEGAQVAGPWIVRSSRLSQFQVARVLLYE